MSTELPYRYDDEIEDTLFVTPGSIEMHKGNRVASMKAPTGDDAVALAEAVLAADGLDCAVIDRGLLARSLRAAGESAALSMRQRAAQWLEEHHNKTDAAKVRALPLLADDAQDVEGADPCRSFTSDPGHPDDALYCEHASGDGHGGLHYADIEGRIRTWTDAQAIARSLEATHADLPEAVTPCGYGTRDVHASTDLAAVDCLDCLRALAQAAHGDALASEDLVEPGDEVPALAELADRVAAIEERLDTPPARVVVPPELADQPPTDEPRILTAPARYRDRHGDIWQDRGDGRVGLATVGDRAVELLSAFPFAQAEASWGPLVRVDAPAGGAE